MHKFLLYPDRHLYATLTEVAPIRTTQTANGKLALFFMMSC
jgi:hypothetical protein